MTLLVTEIHALDGLRRSRVLVAADRRLSLPNGRYGATRKKIFRCERLPVLVGYFGLASFRAGRRTVCFSDWLPTMLRRSTVATLDTLSHELAGELTALVPLRTR